MFDFLTKRKQKNTDYIKESICNLSQGLRRTELQLGAIEDKLDLLMEREDKTQTENLVREIASFKENTTSLFQDFLKQMKSISEAEKDSDDKDIWNKVLLFVILILTFFTAVGSGVMLFALFK